MHNYHMLGKISVVINTFNEARNIERAIKSVQWADEVIVCDMHSVDQTVDFAKNLGAKVFFTKRLEYVEPARNFAISKASNEWILVIDPDEEVSVGLRNKLLEIVSKFKHINYVKIPRKNIIFGYWMKAAMWWPDYNIRFFKKGTIKWDSKIHSIPKLTGEGIDLSQDENLAIIHNNYENIEQYLEKMIRYTKIQAQELKDQGYIFSWKDLIIKPVSEFLSRFFLNRGYQDGLHGLVLSLLQAFSFLVLYIQLWKDTGYKQESIKLSEFKQVTFQTGKEVEYWFKYVNLSKNPLKRFFQKVGNKI